MTSPSSPINGTETRLDLILAELKTFTSELRALREVVAELRPPLAPPASLARLDPPSAPGHVVASPGPSRSSRQAARSSTRTASKEPA